MRTSEKMLNIFPFRASLVREILPKGVSFDALTQGQA